MYILYSENMDSYFHFITVFIDSFCLYVFYKVYILSVVQPLLALQVVLPKKGLFKPVQYVIYSLFFKFNK